MGKNYFDSKLKIFSLNASQELAKNIADSIGTELGKCSVRTFSDGEVQINIEESVRGDHVYVIQATSYPVNDHLLELLIMIDALKRASAKSINIVLPYYGYARQDRTAKPREPITAKLIANLLEKAGANRVLTLDLHAVQLQGFFDIPVDNLFTMPLFAKYFQDEVQENEEDWMVVSPKNSGVKRARELATYLSTGLAIVDQEYHEKDASKDYVIGNVSGKKCIIVDDIINTGGTCAIAAEVLKHAGAKDIVVVASHGVFSSGAKEKLEQAPISKLLLTDSIDGIPDKHIKGLEILTCSVLMGQAIRRIHENQPMSPLFKL